MASNFPTDASRGFMVGLDQSTPDIVGNQENAIGWLLKKWGGLGIEGDGFQEQDNAMTDATKAATAFANIIMNSEGESEDRKLTKANWLARVLGAYSDTREGTMAMNDNWKRQQLDMLRMPENRHKIQKLLPMISNALGGGDANPEFQDHQLISGFLDDPIFQEEMRQMQVGGKATDFSTREKGRWGVAEANAKNIERAGSTSQRRDAEVNSAIGQLVGETVGTAIPVGGGFALAGRGAIAAGKLIGNSNKIGRGAQTAGKFLQGTAIPTKTSTGLAAGATGVGAIAASGERTGEEALDTGRTWQLAANFLPAAGYGLTAAVNRGLGSSARANADSLAGNPTAPELEANPSLRASMADNEETTKNIEALARANSLSDNRIMSTLNDTDGVYPAVLPKGAQSQLIRPKGGPVTKELAEQSVIDGGNFLTHASKRLLETVRSKLSVAKGGIKEATKSFHSVVRRANVEKARQKSILQKQYDDFWRNSENGEKMLPISMDKNEQTGRMYRLEDFFQEVSRIVDGEEVTEEIAENFVGMQKLSVHSMIRDMRNKFGRFQGSEFNMKASDLDSLLTDLGSMARKLEPINKVGAGMVKDLYKKLRPQLDSGLGDEAAGQLRGIDKKWKDLIVDRYYGKFAEKLSQKGVDPNWSDDMLNAIFRNSDGQGSAEYNEARRFFGEKSLSVSPTVCFMSRSGTA